MDIVFFDIYKTCGKAAFPTYVQNIGFKTVDYAVCNDGRDAQNYYIPAPRWNKTETRSYENWINFKPRIDCRFLKGNLNDGITVHKKTVNKCGCETGCTTNNYHRIKNIKLWIHYIPSKDFDIYFGLTNEYQKPIKDVSKVALTKLSTLENANDGVYIEGIKFKYGENDYRDYIDIPKYESLESNYLVLQLALYNGGVYQFANNVFEMKFTYDLD